MITLSLYEFICFLYKKNDLVLRSQKILIIKQEMFVLLGQKREQSIMPGIY